MKRAKLPCTASLLCGLLASLAAGRLALAAPTVHAAVECRAGTADAAALGQRIDDFYWAADPSVEEMRPLVYRQALGFEPQTLRRLRVHEPVPDDDTDTVEVWAAALQRVDAGRRHGLPAVRCPTVYAAHFLNRLVDDLGPSHPYVRQWIKAQAAVCARGALPPAMVTADAALARRQRLDRELQAAERLSGQAQHTAYLALAASGSPHRAVARYRLITGDTYPRPQFTADEYREVAQLLQTLLSEPRLAAARMRLRRIIGKLSFDNMDYVDETLPASDESPAGRVFTDLLIDTMMADLLAPTASMAKEPAAQFAFTWSSADLSWFLSTRETDWWLREMHWSRQRRSAFKRAAGRYDLAAWLLASATASALTENVNWTFHRQLAAQQRDNTWFRLRTWLRQHRAPAAAQTAWEPVLAAMDEIPAAALWARVDALVREIGTCEDGPASAIVGRLFYHAIRRSVMDGDLASATAGLARYPWRDQRHAWRAVGDALRFVMAEGRWDDVDEIRIRMLPVLDAALPTDNITWRLESERRDIFALLAFAATDEQQFVAAIRLLGEWPPIALMQTMSTRSMFSLAADESLEARVRAGLGRALVTRQFLLEGELPLAMESLLARTNPAIGRYWQGLRLRAPKRQDRRLIFNLLATPRMTVQVTSGHVSLRPHMYMEDKVAPDSLDRWQHSSNNWWCALDTYEVYRDVDADLARALKSTDENPMFPDIDLRPNQRRILERNAVYQRPDADEIKRLSAATSAPRLLGEAVIEWAERSTWYTRLLGWDDGLDYALHRVVVATRYGCQRQGGHGAYSRRAFELLHQRFPDSPWTAKTPYWFDYQHFFHDYQRVVERQRAVQPLQMK